MKRGFSVLAYHMVEPRFDFGITRVTPRQFRRHVNLLAELGFEAVRLDALGQNSFRPSVALTFDDAYLSVYEHALPVLAERGWPATIFAVSDYVGRLNTWDVNLGGLKFPHVDWGQLREFVAAGWQVGSHGASHRYLGFLPDAELRNELRRSKALLEDRLGMEVTALAPPYGRASTRVLREAASAGYREVALLYGSTRRAMVQREGLTVFARQGVYLTDGVLVLRRKLLAGEFGRRFFDLTQAVVGLGSRGSILVQFFQTRIWPALLKAVGRR